MTLGLCVNGRLAVTKCRKAIQKYLSISFVFSLSILFCFLLTQIERPINERFWATICKTVCPMLSVRCPVCLSVTLVYCGQRVGRIKTKLGTQVGLGPGHTVLDGDPPPPP